MTTLPTLEGSGFTAEPSSPELAAAPFMPGGLGYLMLSAADAYAEEYVFSLDDGPDHEPTEFEAAMLADFLAGLVSDEAFFGPIRRVLHQAAAAEGLFAALRQFFRRLRRQSHIPLGTRRRPRSLSQGSYYS